MLSGCVCTIEKTVIRNNGQKISWTVSIGVAISGKTVTSVETLIKHADIACYAAKQHGRNRVMDLFRQI